MRCARTATCSRGTADHQAELDSLLDILLPTGLENLKTRQRTRPVKAGRRGGGNEGIGCRKGRGASGEVVQKTWLASKGESGTSLESRTARAVSEGWTDEVIGGIGRRAPVAVVVEVVVKEI
jgi:hypothetical protein